jgi:hypothetical protein
MGERGEGDRRKIMIHVQLVNAIWKCECKEIMQFIDNEAPRYMKCTNVQCEHFGVVFIEPEFTATYSHGPK